MIKESTGVFGRIAVLLVLIFTIFSCQPKVKEFNFEYLPLEDYFVEDDAMNGECAIVDVNGDGHPDLWWSVYAFAKSERDKERYERHRELYQMAWYKGPDFKEMFRMYKGVTYGGNWMDMDNDGDMDCVTGRAINSLEFIWLENPGQPEGHRDWTEHFIHRGAVNSDNTMFADINQDGRDDIVVQSFRNDVHFFPAPADPKKGPWEIYHLGHSDHPRTGACLGDVDGDNDIDVVWGHGWLENPGEITQGFWKDHVIDPDFYYDAQSVVTDLDNDGRSDIILASEESFDGLIWYSWDTSAEKWLKHPIVTDSTYSGLHSLRIADFDLDGDMDIFTAEMAMSGYIKQVAPHKVTVFENVNITKNEWREHVIAETGSHSARVGDINGDGYPDIIGSNWNNRLECCPLRADVWINKIGSN
jgi:hypothetical protein